MIKTLSIMITLLVLCLAAVTYLALELGGVIEVETWNAEDARSRVTHIWFVQTEEGILLEAGDPQNPWVRDLSTNKTLKIRGEGIEGEYRHEFSNKPLAHDEIRNRMREKYGWRDAWISRIFNVENSLMVRIFPI